MWLRFALLAFRQRWKPLRIPQEWHRYNAIEIASRCIHREDAGPFGEYRTKLFSTLKTVRPGVVRYERETGSFESDPAPGWEKYHVKVTISGGTVLGSNMEIAPDRKSVSQTLAVDEMSKGKKGRNVPDVYFAEFEVSE
jgi:hypothetical protein